MCVGVVACDSGKLCRGCGSLGRNLGVHEKNAMCVPPSCMVTTPWCPLQALWSAFKRSPQIACQTPTLYNAQHSHGYTCAFFAKGFQSPVSDRIRVE